MNKLFIKITLLMSLLSASLGAGAQTVKGVVKDANGDVLPGVSVIISGTTTGVSTGLDGDFSISVPDVKTASLVFSCIGLKDEVVKLEGRTVIDVVMVEDNNFLEETVVIGYATVKRRDLMGSVSSVDTKALTAGSLGYRGSHR